MLFELNNFSGSFSSSLIDLFCTRIYSIQNIMSQRATGVGSAAVSTHNGQAIGQCLVPQEEPWED